MVQDFGFQTFLSGEPLWLSGKVVKNGKMK
jgi:hypothetical protein